MRTPKRISVPHTNTTNNSTLPNNFKCEHVLYAAEKAGIKVEKLVNRLDTSEHWKRQYLGLSSFEVPSSALLCDVNLDDDVKLLAPLAVPARKGRPSTKRKDNAYNQAAAAGKKSAKNSRGATPGSSSAPRKSSGRKTKGGGAKGGEHKRQRR